MNKAPTITLIFISFSITELRSSTADSYISPHNVFFVHQIQKVLNAYEANDYFRRLSLADTTTKSPGAELIKIIFELTSF